MTTFLYLTSPSKLWGNLVLFLLRQVSCCLKSEGQKSCLKRLPCQVPTHIWPVSLLSPGSSNIPTLCLQSSQNVHFNSKVLLKNIFVANAKLLEHWFH